MWLLCLPLVVPALAGAAGRPLAARLEPRHATWLLTAAAVALAACSLAALALLAAYAAAGRHSWPRRDYSSRSCGAARPIPAAAGGGRRAGADRGRRRGHGHGPQPGAGPGPVVPAGRQACTPRTASSWCPARPSRRTRCPACAGRIVVSGRLLDCLDDRRRAALIAHEQAHLASRIDPVHQRGPPGRRGQPAPDPGSPLGGLHRGTLGRRARRRRDQRPQAGRRDHRPGRLLAGPRLTGPRRRRPAGWSWGSPGPAPRASRWPGPGRCPAASPPCSPRRRGARPSSSRPAR